MKGPPGGGTWTEIALIVVALVGAAIAVALTPPLRDAVGSAVSGDHEAVREDLQKPAGFLLVIALAAVHAVVFYPAEILDAAVGYAYGFAGGTALVMACWVMNALISYVIGRRAARPLVHRLAGRERFERTERAVERGGITLLLAMRLIPIVPFSLFSYAAGAARVPVWRFTWTTAVGYTPLTAYFVYLGSRLEGFSLADPILWIGAIALIAGLFLVRTIAPRES